MPGFRSSTALMTAMNAILSTFVFAGALSAVYFGGLACIANPIDPHLKAHLDGGSKGRTKAADDKSFCWVCQVHVMKTSKHCRFCEKCIDRFDHHCQWLNTCIGSHNYPDFFRCVTAVFWFTFWELLAFAFTAALWFTQGEDGHVRSNIRSTYGIARGGGETTFLSLFFIYMFVVAVTVAMIAQLFFFHIMLKRKGMSTFEYVVADARKQQQKDKEREERRYKKRQSDKKRKENGGVHICCGCWIGGEDKTPAAPAERQGMKEGREEQEEGHVEVGNISSTQSDLVVRDYDHEHAI